MNREHEVLFLVLFKEWWDDDAATLNLIKVDLTPSITWPKFDLLNEIVVYLKWLAEKKSDILCTNESEQEILKRDSESQWQKLTYSVPIAVVVERVINLLKLPRLNQHLRFSLEFELKSTWPNSNILSHLVKCDNYLTFRELR